MLTWPGGSPTAEEATFSGAGALSSALSRALHTALRATSSGNPGAACCEAVASGQTLDLSLASPSLLAQSSSLPTLRRPRPAAGPGCSGPLCPSGTWPCTATARRPMTTSRQAQHGISWHSMAQHDKCGTEQHGAGRSRLARSECGAVDVERRQRRGGTLLPNRALPLRQARSHPVTVPRPARLGAGDGNGGRRARFYRSHR